MREPLAGARLRAPREHGRALLQPPLSQAGELLAENRTCAGQPWQLDVDRQQLRAAARQETAQLACDWTRQYRDLPANRLDAESPWIVSGHQPQLFHPGVWFKNFALSQLASQHQAVGLNLVIDNDVCTRTSVRAPVRHGERWRYETVPWDQAAPGLPFEDCPIGDEALFDSFADRVAAAIAPLTESPLVRPLWPLAVQRRRAGEPVGSCLAAARHHLEGQLGLGTLEAPLGAVFELPSACRWIAAVLTAPHLAESYNQLLRRFRQQHRIRSRSHPVPDLQREDSWWEAPFWVWTRQAPRRRRLFVRKQGSRWELSDRDAWRRAASAGELPHMIAELPRDGVRLRPRALMTTLYARTVLSDLFLHGIGGAVYDELTDALMEEVLAIRPPAFVAATATMKLRDAPVNEVRGQIRATRRQLRDLTYNPQRHLEPQHSGAADRRLAAEKHQWIARDEPSAQRHQAIVRINRQLQGAVAPLRERLERQLRRLTTELQDHLKLASREHAFCLFDEKKLPDELLDLCRDPE